MGPILLLLPALLALGSEEVVFAVAATVLLLDEVVGKVEDEGPSNADVVGGNVDINTEVEDGAGVGICDDCAGPTGVVPNTAATVGETK